MTQNIKKHKRAHAPWRAWFAWYPVRVHGQWTWLKTVYRYCTNNYVNQEDWPRFQYGTIFDVVRDE